MPFPESDTDCKFHFCICLEVLSSKVFFEPGGQLEITEPNWVNMEDGQKFHQKDFNKFCATQGMRICIVDQNNFIAQQTWPFSLYR